MSPRRPHLVGRRLDAALHQKGRSHLERAVERRHEAQVGPGSAAEDQALAEGVAEGVGGDDDPLRAGAVGAAEVGELEEEGVHVGGRIAARCDSGGHDRCTGHLLRR